MADETTWMFEAGDRVPEWLIRQINCTLTFHRDAVVVERQGCFDLYPMSAMSADDAIVLAHVDRGMDAEVEHVRPLTVHVVPRVCSLN